MNLDELWRLVLSEIELQVSRPTFKTIFAQTKLLSFRDGIITIACNTPVTLNFLEGRYYHLLKNILDKHTKQNNSLRFQVDSTEKAEKKAVGPLLANLLEKPPATVLPPSINRKVRLNPLYTFENFAVSTTNQMAYAAASAVSLSPGASYNPLFFYGGTGVGKTHLMQAIGNLILTKKPQTKIVYCMGEEFTNEIIEAIKNKTTDVFKKKYRGLDILLLDDVQFLAGKNAVQEEFFHTFNAIYRDGGQIVLTSDKPPHEIARLEERLSSRFEGGLIIDISPPDFELRTAILLIKARQKGVDVPIEVAKAIAATIENPRRLEGTLVRLITEAHTKNEVLSLDLALQIIGKPGGVNPVQKSITPKEVLGVVAERFGVKPSQLKGPRRDVFLALPRQILYFLLRQEMGLSLTEIGSFLGGRDHTTILHGVKKVSSLLTLDGKLKEDMSLIKSSLWG